MNKLIKLVECSDPGITYGYLEVENVSTKELQKRIDEIKNDPQFLEKIPIGVLKTS